LSNLANVHRVSALVQSFSDILKLRGAQHRILDIGCGQGAFTRALQQRSELSEMIGLDISLSQIPIEAKRYNTIEFVNADANFLPFKDNSFDFVFSGQVIEYIPDPDYYLSEMFRVLMVGGLELLPQSILHGGPTE